MLATFLFIRFGFQQCQDYENHEQTSDIRVASANTTTVASPHHVQPVWCACEEGVGTAESRGGCDGLMGEPLLRNRSHLIQNNVSRKESEQRRRRRGEENTVQMPSEPLRRAISGSENWCATLRDLICAARSVESSCGGNIGLWTACIPIRGVFEVPENGEKCRIAARLSATF
ncbi:hypothetical protein BDP67DRAFT_487718 [Colletotrichum lupini]|nr:hypothetical protein BDP67DRAFT_487718 [Colletotrichum lupini]